jgi:leucyl/phenylalanyl-tRNA--protein transferase
MIPWLERHTPFPSVEQALAEPNGLLAAGGDLSPERLLDAYRHGIFPWFAPGEPILWWSPDPRMVLVPSEFKCSKSLAKTLRNLDYEIRSDTAFEAVMRTCAEPREEGGGTWIVEEMIAAYGELHRLGYAHSVEVWQNRELVGGLYGVALGRMFYGESMFSRRRDGSKIALAHLAQRLNQAGFGLIDCQFHTPHLAALGARPVSRSEFILRLKTLTGQPAMDFPLA